MTSLSERVAMRRQSFNPPKTRSIRFLARLAVVSLAMGVSRDLVEG